MAWPVILAAMAVSAMGQMQADADQANAELANARFFREQALFQRAATERELQVFRNKAANSLGNTIGAYAKGGVALSASALEVISGERQKALDEEGAIQREGDFRSRLAMLRANSSEETAGNLTSDGRKFLTVAGTASQAAAMYYGGKG
jgi:hypothetical protein